MRGSPIGDAFLVGMTLLAMMLFGVAASAQDCGAALEAAKTEWRSLTRGNHQVAPATQIGTSDGRHLTGSQINYARVLISRAESACRSGSGAAAMMQIQEAQSLFRPASQPLNAASQ
jgi:hypothetical protein